METRDIENRLSVARTRLILDKPFLGALVLRLPMEEGDPSWCKTVATDARKFYYNLSATVANKAHQWAIIFLYSSGKCIRRRWWMKPPVRRQVLEITDRCIAGIRAQHWKPSDPQAWWCSPAECAWYEKCHEKWNKERGRRRKKKKVRS